MMPVMMSKTTQLPPLFVTPAPSVCQRCQLASMKGSYLPSKSSRKSSRSGGFNDKAVVVKSQACVPIVGKSRRFARDQN